MSFSSVGRTKVAAQVAFLVIDVIVLALAVSVNRFQDYFFVADLFPLALSFISLAAVLTHLAIDVSRSARYVIRAQTDIATFGVLAVLWLSFNAFSTARWQNVPLHCASIPAGKPLPSPFSFVALTTPYTDFADQRAWCSALQALKAFVWIAFLLTLGISLFTTRYALTQYQRGNRHVLTASFARYHPSPFVEFEQPSVGPRSSEFLQFPEKFTS